MTHEPLFDPAAYVRIRSGDLFHLARLEDRAGSTLCREVGRGPRLDDLIDDVALPGRPLTGSAVLCAVCQRVATLRPREPL